MITIDFTGIEEAKESSLLLNGKYSVQISKIEKATAKKSGNPMWIVEFKVNYGQFKGSKIIDYFPLVDCKGKIMNLLKSCGYDISKKQVNVDIEELMGASCYISVKQELYEKQDNKGQGVTNKVNFGGIYPIGEYLPEFENDLFDPKLMGKTKKQNTNDLIGEDEVLF